MLATAKNWLHRALGNLRVAVVTPVGPGHADLYAECRASVQAAWRCGRGPFSAITCIAVDDSEGKLGRSRARNIGIERAIGEGADWLFFLDADDLMAEGAFDAVGDYVGDHDAVWGLILGLSPGAARPHLRIPQVVTMNTIDDLLLFDPFLTLQMGHFVRTPVVQSVRFDESLDAGEDFDYYLRLWVNSRCAKVAREFFINRHARRSTGPRAASAEDWGAAVRARQRAELEQRAPAGGVAREIRNARSAELQRFCRQHGVVGAEDCIALSKQMPFHGDVEVNEYEGGGLVLHTDNDDAVCAQLAWRGEYQPFAAALWQAMAAAGGTIVDVGAGTGLYALLAARVAPAARIVCFEPVSENGARLRRNAEQNGARNIELIEAAASDFDGQVHLRLQSADTMLPLKAEIGAASGRPLQCLRIDDYVARMGCGAVGLARISSDSDAIAVLRGMQQMLAERRPDLLVDLPAPAAAYAVDAALRRHGYRCYAIGEGERELRALEADPARRVDDGLQLLASARPPAVVGRLAATARGRLQDN